MVMDTQISKKKLAFCYQTCPLIARRIIGGNFFGGCFKAPIFSSKTSKIANDIYVNWRDVVVLDHA